MVIGVLSLVTSMRSLVTGVRSWVKNHVNGHDKSSIESLCDWYWHALNSVRCEVSWHWSSPCLWARLVSVSLI